MPKKSKPSKKKTLAQLFKIPTFKKPDPCCVDVLKTGQAYSVPLGFKDYKGTERIDNKTSNLPIKSVGISPITIFKPKTPSPIFVQPTDMGVPTTLGPNKDITIIRPGPVRTGVKQTIRIPIKGATALVDTVGPSEPYPTASGIAKQPIPSTTQIDKPKTPSVIFVQPMDESTPLPEPKKDITIMRPLPPNVELVRGAISQTIRVPRKNSRAELENRYEAMTGSRYSGPNLTNAEFRQLVEFISNKKNV